MVHETVYYRPRSIAEAQRLAEAGAVYGAGLTALQLGWAGDLPEQGVIDVTCLDLGPPATVLPDGRIRMAANATLEEIRLHPALAPFPILTGLVRSIGATPVRNLATIGGNLLWGGDLVVLVAAFGARLCFCDHAVDVETMDEVPAGLLMAVEMSPGPGFVEKVGFRAAFTPARVLVAGRVKGKALRLALRAQGGPVVAADLPSGACVDPAIGALVARSHAKGEDAAIAASLLVHYARALDGASS